jgi:hypothetical protein
MKNDYGTGLGPEWAGRDIVRKFVTYRRDVLYVEQGPGL